MLPMCLRIKLFSSFVFVQQLEGLICLNEVTVQLVIAKLTVFMSSVFVLESDSHNKQRVYSGKYYCAALPLAVRHLYYQQSPTLETC